MPAMNYFLIFIHYDESRNSLAKIILYLIHHVKSSTSVNRKALKLDNKVKATNHCDVGKSCRAVGEEMSVGRTQIMHILKRKREILDVLKTMLPVQHRVTGNCTFVY
jgi:hypothetical protein